MELLTEEQVRLTIVGLFLVVLVIVAKYLEYRELKNRHQRIKANKDKTRCLKCTNL